MKNTESINRYMVCIEGLDGCGKDSQLELLKEKGFFVTSEPNYDSPIGKAIKSILSKEFSPHNSATIEYLFAADRKEHISILNNHISEHNTAKEKLCITGRYKYSGIVYSTDIKLTQYVNSGMPEAGLFIFLDIKPKEALDRIKQRTYAKGIENDIYENLDKLTVVYKEFNQLIYHFKSDMVNNGQLSPEVVIINAEQSIEDIHIQILEVLDNYIKTLED